MFKEGDSVYWFNGTSWEPAIFVKYSSDYECWVKVSIGGRWLEGTVYTSNVASSEAVESKLWKVLE